MRPRHIQDWNPSVERREGAKGPCEVIRLPHGPTKRSLLSHASHPKISWAQTHTVWGEQPSALTGT